MQRTENSANAKRPKTRICNTRPPVPDARGSILLCLHVDVPDFCQERRQLLVLELEREAHLGVLVAERPQLREHAEQLGEDRARLRSSSVIHVGTQRFEIYLLDFFHFPALRQTWSV